MDLPDIAKAWRERGRIDFLGGLDVFSVDSGCPDADSAVLFLHGFPSSSFDWHQVFDAMGPSVRVIAPDFPGFGFSAKPVEYSYSLMDQTDRVLMLLARRGISNVRIIAHDMGTSVACELLARREMRLLPISIKSLMLMNGSLFIEQARLTLSQRLLRSPLAGVYAHLASETLFRWQLRRILAGPVDDAELVAMWALMTAGDGIRRLPATIRYVSERYRYYQRWTGPLARLDLPVSILWGKRDPVAVSAIAIRLAETIPGARLEFMDDLGHYPQLEDPARVATAIRKFLGVSDTGYDLNKITADTAGLNIDVK
jgi:pimeloyl-ACP methyl ester carboxylesterase